MEPEIKIDFREAEKIAAALSQAKVSTVKSLGYKGMEALRLFVETGSTRWPPLRRVTLLFSKTRNSSPLFFLGRFARYLAKDESVTVGFLPFRFPRYAYQKFSGEGSPEQKKRRAVPYKEYPVKDWIINAESGKTTPVSPRMRRYFGYRGMPLRGSTKNLIQPPRPIFRDFLQDWKQKISAEYENTYVKKVEKR